MRNMKEKKILFLHGFYASGQCVPALALKEAFEKKVTVLTPDLPLHPADAISLIRDICDKEKPDVLVGNSCGSFYAQMISPIIGVPALLGNPHFKMSDFLRERIGSHQYKSPRANGIQFRKTSLDTSSTSREISTVWFTRPSTLRRSSGWMEKKL